MVSSRLRFHLSHIEIDSFPSHPILPMIVRALIPCRVRDSRPALKPVWTCCGENLWNRVPRKPRGTGHVHGVARAKTEHHAARLVFVANHEYTVAAKTDADQRSIAFLTDVPVQTERVAGGVKVDDGRFGYRVGKHAVQESRDVCGKVWRGFVGIHLVCPVVLAAQCHPAEFAVQHGLYR